MGMAAAQQRDMVDLLVIGGGINGVGIARDAVGRGLSVAVCEMRDLASATSSASSKLIHGGLRYLEHYEFRLVREALQERETLLRMAPHIIWPMRFVLPHDPSMRPAWMLRIGLFLYDHLGGREILPGSEGIDLRRHPYGKGVAPGFGKAFVYSDCWVEDARLVTLNALDAHERGAAIHVRTKLVAARREADRWIATLEHADGSRFEMAARALVNAAGPWVADVLNGKLGQNSSKSVRLVKGSHIVVPKLHDGDQAFILQNSDKRIVFVIPYERNYSLIGTTDIEYHDDPAGVRISADETEYLCAIANRYFAKKITAQDVVWAYSGVRPLYDDASANASAVTRDYVLDLDHGPGKAPLLSIFGGKITTYRCLALEAVEKLQPLLGNSAKAWSHTAPLPGGDIVDADFDAFLGETQHRHPWLPAPLARRYARAYGTRLEKIVNGFRSLDQLGEEIGDGIYAAEVDYLRRTEWAREADDILWRRSKLGLHTSQATQQRLAQWLAANPL